jgi:heterodisulfide reductase subunit C
MAEPGLYDLLKKDVRFEEGLNACINCGTCTAICPAAEFYNYDPRVIADKVQTKNNEVIEDLLKGDEIWYCGECMSCKTRCPRNNAPGLIIMALRSLSQDLGYFTESEKGRQQLFIKRSIGEWILNYGYCVYAPQVKTEMFPEQGPVWDWESEHLHEVFTRLGGNLGGEGPGILRKVPQKALDELHKIFEVTGGLKRYENIEKLSAEKALQMGLQFDDTHNCEYFHHVFSKSAKDHNHS